MTAPIKVERGVVTPAGLTQGPWFAGRFIAGAEHYAVGLSLVDHGKGELVSGCRPLGDTRQDYMLVSGICSEADARAIAAAPELLDALTGLLAMVDKMDLPPPAGGGVLPVDKALATHAARIAIAKVAGGAL